MTPNILTDEDERRGVPTVPIEIREAIEQISLWLWDEKTNWSIGINKWDDAPRWYWVGNVGIASVTTTFADGTVETKQIDTEEVGETVMPVCEMTDELWDALSPVGHEIEEIESIFDTLSRRYADLIPADTVRECFDLFGEIESKIDMLWILAGGVL